MSRLSGRINVKLTDGAFERHRVLVHFAQNEGALWVQGLLLAQRQIRVGCVVPARRVQKHPLAPDVQRQAVPVPIVDVVVEAHRVPLAYVHQHLPRGQLHPQLQLLLPRQDTEDEGAVDAMGGKAEDHGEVGGGVGGGQDGAQRHLDPCPLGEDGSQFDRDDAIRDGARSTGAAPTGQPQPLEHVHICRGTAAHTLPVKHCYALVQGTEETPCSPCSSQHLTRRDYAMSALRLENARCRKAPLR